jgi:excisionase family DNA binding protein
MSASPSHPVTWPANRGPQVRPSTNAEAEIVPRILNLGEAAALVRCSRAHLCNLANGKVKGLPQLPSVRIGRRVLFRREALERWLQQVEAASLDRTNTAVFER